MPSMMPHEDFDESKMYAPEAAARTITPDFGGGSPLSRYYRTRMPGLHVSLPTKGVFLPLGAIQLTQSGDIPVYPMSGTDEMLLKSPDALMSGFALEKLMESCVPGIKTPRLISTPDLDVLLLAIRAATHGETMALTASCPKCKEQSEFDCFLPDILATMTYVDPENPVRLSDEVVAYVRPYTLHSATHVALASFEEARRLQGIDKETTDNATRNRAMNETMLRMTKVNAEALSDSLIKVVVPGAEVTDRTEIRDFFNNIPKPWWDKIEKKVTEVNGKRIDKKIKVKCHNKKCKHEWSTDVEFDPSTFFDVASSP